ncbi:MAG: (Fe-S)-binding protein [Chloroflexi bacterium]|nr:(Fe-S)-binding protein [Chloroflexota bacterium]
MKVNAHDFAQEYTLLECIQCGRCTGGCPVSLKTALNIRSIIYQALVDDAIEVNGMDVLWDCTNCLTCTIRCPKDVHPSDVIIGLRGYIVGEGKGVPPRVRDALMSAFTRGNTLGFATEDRDKWTEGLGFEVKNVLEAGETDVLFYVGCTPAYDPRIQPVTRALATVMHRAGIDFGTLGVDEMCCGNEIRRIGESEGFESMVEEFHEMRKEFQARRMVTVSPHCYNAFRNEYGDLGFPVYHYTQFLVELLETGQLTFDKEVRKRVTYHDPCFLGKHNNIYDEPRQVLRSIPGLEFEDLDRSRERSVCCEGGGGRMWAEGTNIEERLAHQRVRDAIALGAEVLAVSCAFCLLTLEDAVKTLGLDEQIQVMDIMELVAQAT